MRAEMATSRLRISLCIRLFVSAGSFTHEVTHSRYYHGVSSARLHQTSLNVIASRDDDGCRTEVYKCEKSNSAIGHNLPSSVRSDVSDDCDNLLDLCH